MAEPLDDLIAGRIKTGRSTGSITILVFPRVRFRVTRREKATQNTPQLTGPAAVRSQDKYTRPPAARSSYRPVWHCRTGSCAGGRFDRRWVRASDSRVSWRVSPRQSPSCREQRLPFEEGKDAQTRGASGRPRGDVERNSRAVHGRRGAYLGGKPTRSAVPIPSGQETKNDHTETGSDEDDRMWRGRMRLEMGVLDKET